MAVVRHHTGASARVMGLPAFAAFLVACASSPPPEVVVQPAPSPDTVTVVDTVMLEASADEDMQRRIASLEFQLLERDALIVEMQQKLDAAIQEVVRAMARLQTVASRAEAASAMAEAEIALQGLSDAAGGETVTEGAQATRLLELSTTEFINQNYGGALYLASQARSVARSGAARLQGGAFDATRPGEERFALPVPLRTLRRSNVRDGPGLDFGVLFTLEADAPIIGVSYAGQWVRVTDDEERTGWIFHSLIGSRQPN